MPSRSDSRRQYDAHRAVKHDWRNWYKLARWQAIRRDQLNREPLCVLCQAAGRLTSATVCDHVERHGGDPERFWNGPFQSLCKPCHDRDKQRAERSPRNRP